jgi:hypothetical protein
MQTEVGFGAGVIIHCIEGKELEPLMEGTNLLRDDKSLVHHFHE